jgi:radical SAM superfamily enzyme YgiQ (UPF0313 family)
MPPVCLIIPPSVFLLDERVFVSLGVLRVAAVLERGGHPVEVLDLSGIENYLDAAEDHARASAATVFGLTATTPQLPAAREIVERIRTVRPEARIVMGGPHVTLVNAARKREARVGKIVGRGHAAFDRLRALADVLVAGDGEAAVFQALTGGGVLVDADEPKSDLFLTNDDYDGLPIPARHLVDMSTYRYEIDGRPAVSLIAQLGCPFGCGFCGGRNAPSLRQIRTRSTASIVREIEALYRTYGYTGFMFYDDELNVSRSMVELMNAISDLQARLGVDFRLRGFVKSELFNAEQAAAMYRAGFRWLLVGFEAANERILENINKRATRDDNTRSMDTATRHGLKVKALMSLGHPGESDRTAADLQDWLLEVRPADFDCTIITTYPGTPYYDEAQPHRDLPGVYTYTAARSQDRLHAYDVDFSEVAEYYKGDPDGGYRAYVFTDHLSSTELVAVRDSIERTVRSRLNIPFNPTRAAARYEHSMGMQGPLPPHILRSTSSPASVVSD